MKRPITICSGQFGDLPLETLCAKMHELGYEGLEVATQAHVASTRSSPTRSTARISRPRWRSMT